MKINNPNHLLGLLSFRFFVLRGDSERDREREESEESDELPDEECEPDDERERRRVLLKA